MRNAAKPKNNKSGVAGVSWYKKLSKWVVKIENESKQIHIGYFYCLSIAAKARKEAEIKYNYHENHGRNY